MDPFCESGCVGPDQIYGTLDDTIDSTCTHAIEAFKTPPASADANQVEKWERQDNDLHKFLRDTIPEALDHTGSAAFDVHLRGVQAVLRHWEADEELTKAGLFHSIYGTEGLDTEQTHLTEQSGSAYRLAHRLE